MVRTTIVPDKQSISFDIPMDYIGKQIDVIAFSLDEGLKDEKMQSKKVTFNALSVDTRGFKFNRDEANER